MGIAKHRIAHEFPNPLETHTWIACCMYTGNAEIQRLKLNAEHAPNFAIRYREIS